MIREDEEHPEELRYDILGRVGKILFVHNNCYQYLLMVEKRLAALFLFLSSFLKKKIFFFCSSVCISERGENT